MLMRAISRHTFSVDFLHPLCARRAQNFSATINQETPLPKIVLMRR
jgi:hypothetical protein